MKILLIGATGQLGGDIVRNNRDHEIVAPGRNHLDLLQPGQIEGQVRDVAPDIVINCAAFHNVPLCEEKPEQAFLVNCVAVGQMAAICHRADIRLVTFSSDYVFGGDKRTPYLESDPPRPLQIYGITRASGEYAALSEAPEHTLIVRTCGLYGRSGATSKGGNFVDKRIDDAKRAKSLEMASDQTLSPTSTDDLSRAVLRLISHQSAGGGIYHLVNEGHCTWFEFTKAIYEEMSMDTKVVPVDRKGMSGQMRRPLYSVLGNSAARAIGITLPPWRDALGRYLKNKYAS